MTGGMDNPVDVVFTPGGERIFTSTFFQHPGGGKRDGLIHAIYGGIYGKVHGPIFEPAHKWTGPEVMPVLLHLGPAAPCGLTRYESTAFGHGVPGQPLRLLLQPAQGRPARPDAERGDASRPRTRTS